MNEIQQTTTNNLGCVQPLAGNEDEDCLSLDVFTPLVSSKYLSYCKNHLNKRIYTQKLPSDPNAKPLPVMVWIHGGAFSLGHALEYVPTRYMEHDIVLVVVQYRLGPLGKI